ncbi:MAG: IclR family transcriptional regulator [Firmicutes bacterium HGW-Firmicutes-11]|jgi:DNA-binding IclR family transcriptional regulator|nr:MAG: IclR family transcriptional regulator [Firmicutes bacterium HGW-Firmicutes-11]
MEERSNRVKSIEKAMNIIEVLDNESELSLGEISERLAMDKGTVHRLVATLKYCGYVDQNLETKKYSNSLKLFEMGNRVVEKKGLRKVAEPFIKEAAALAGETINLGVQHEGNIIYIDKIETSETIKVGLNIGRRIPSYCTGLGKAILAFLSPERREELLSGVEFYPYTPHTVRDRESLERQLAMIREQGYCIDDQEYVDGLICIAAPVFDHNNDPIAAVSVSIPKYRYDAIGKKIDYISIAKNAAGKISGELGSRRK